MIDKKKKQGTFASGSGGGGGSSARDNLWSTDAFEAVLGICEGPIYGLDGDTVEEQLKNLYIDDVAFLDAQGSKNFEDTSFLIRYEAGNELSVIDDPIKGQDPIKYVLEGNTTPHPVGVALTPNVQFKRTIPTSIRGQFDLVEVRIGVNQLAKITKNGYKETSADLRILWRYVGTNESWRPVLGSTLITGKTTVGGLVRGYYFVPTEFDKDIEIAVKLSEPNYDSHKEIKELVWIGYETTKTSTSDNPEYHLGTAMLQVAAVVGKELQRLPTFSGVWKGLLCSIPSNYDPTTRIYDDSSPWDGEFKRVKHWTDNPFWIAHELITNKRIGYFSVNPHVTVNRFSLYDKAVYADELLENPDGTFSPRFTFNGVLTQPYDGMEFINYILGSANAQAYDNSVGQIVIVADMNTPAVATITPEQCLVISEGIVFSYSYTDLKDRPNEITSSFIDTNLNWEKQYIGPIVDTESQQRFGVNLLEFENVGCIYAQEAWRKMYFRLITAQTETCSVSFSMPKNSVFFELFDIINIVDPDQDWGISSRILKLEERVISLREPLYFEELGEFQLHLQTKFEGVKTFTIQISEIGYHHKLFLDSPIDIEIPEHAPFSIQRSGSAPGLAKPFRIISIAPNDSMGGSVSISAVEVNRNKYYASDNLMLADSPKYNFEMPRKGSAPQNFKMLKEEHLQVSGRKQTNLWLSWDEMPTDFLSSYFELSMIKDGVSFGVVGKTSRNVIEVPDVAFGDYEFNIALIYNGERFESKSLVWTVDSFSLAEDDYDPQKLFVFAESSFKKTDLHFELKVHYHFELDKPETYVDLFQLREIDKAIIIISDMDSGIELTQIETDTGKIIFTGKDHLNITQTYLAKNLKIKAIILDQRGHFIKSKDFHILAKDMPLVTEIEKYATSRELTATPIFDSLPSFDAKTSWYLAEVDENLSAINRRLISSSSSLNRYSEITPDTLYCLWVEVESPYGGMQKYPDNDIGLRFRTLKLNTQDIPGLSKLINIYYSSAIKPQAPLDIEGTWQDPIPENWFDTPPVTTGIVWQSTRVFYLGGAKDPWSEPKRFINVSAELDRLRSQMSSNLSNLWESLIEDVGDIFGTSIERNITEQVIRRVELNETNQEGMTSIVSGLEARINDAIEGIEAVASNLLYVKQDSIGNQRAAQVLRLSVSDLKARYSATLKRLDLVENNADGSQRAFSLLEQAIEDLDRGLAASNRLLQSLTKDADGNVLGLNELSLKVETLDGRVTTSAELLQSVSSSVTGSQEAITSLSQSIVDLDAGLAAANELIQALTRDDEGNLVGYNQLKVALETLDGRVTTSAELLQSVSSSVTGSQEAITSLSQSIVDLDAGLAAANELIQALTRDDEGNLVGYNQLRVEFNALEERVSAASELLQEVKLTVDGRTEALTNLASKISTIENNVANAGLTLSSHQDLLGALSSKLFLEASTTVNGVTRIAGIRAGVEGEISKVAIIGDVFEYQSSDGDVQLSYNTTTKKWIFSGELSAATGSFEGEVRASSGKIKGLFTVGESSVKAGLNGLGAGSETVRIFAGSEDPSLAPFQVLEDGSLKANKAIIEGDMTGSSFNGLRIKMGTFRSTVDGNSTINVDTNEARIYTVSDNDSLNHYITGPKSPPFTRLMGVSITALGPSTVNVGSNMPLITGPQTFRFNRDDGYNNTQYFSYLAFGL